MTSEVKQAIVAPNHAILEEKSFSIVDTHESDAPGSNASNTALPTGLRLFLIMLGLNLGVFLTALDQTIIAPAIPEISNAFNSTADVVWYSSAYFMTSTAFLPLYSRIYRIDLKWTFLSCIFIFEIGSLICAVAQDSTTFIVGRAIAGFGVAGGYVGVMTIVAASVPLDKKAAYAGVVGGVYGIGAVIGPLIGGAFTSRVSWRWCFWINLPIGGITLATIFFFFKPPARPAQAKTGKLMYLFKLDLVGTGLVLGAIVMYLLALQDGGLITPWSSSKEIGLLVGAIVTTIVFWINEYFMGDDALIPLRIFRQRTILSGALFNFMIGGAYFTISYFLPLYFQSRGSSSLRSGVQMLALICGLIFSVTLTGVFAPTVGYCSPFLIGGSFVFAIATGLFQLFSPTTSQAMWVGITFLAGVGGGAAFQFSFVASQAVAKFSQLELEIGGGIVLFFQTLGGALLTAAAQAIFQNQFKDSLVSAQGFDGAAIAAAGQTSFRQLVPAQYLDQAVEYAVDAIRDAFWLPTAAMILGFFISFGFEWNSIKGQAISSAA